MVDVNYQRQRESEELHVRSFVYNMFFHLKTETESSLKHLAVCHRLKLFHFSTFV